jgi:tRNA (cmo5U34)-methyltransferase
MKTELVKKTFENAAFDYDGLIPKLIPRYHEQNDVLISLIPFRADTQLKVLDLGAGTGILSYLILNKFNNASITVFDLAENMLTACKSNLLDYGERVTFKQGNFATDDLGNEYDLVVSGLALHHLNNEQKQRFYQNLFQILKPGGVFLNRDIVVGDTENLTKQYEQLWRQYIKSNGEDDQYWFNKYLEEDIPASVEKQIQWLKEAGFVDVGCHWRYLNFAIFGGYKPKSTIANYPK